MKNKYYKLEYEDLVYGLECEIKKGDKWQKWSFNPSSKFLTFINLILIAKHIRYSEGRVKCLDREDIEECLPNDFKFDNNKYIPSHILTYMKGSIWDDGIKVEYYLETRLLRITKYHFKGEYDNNNSHQLFDGTLKNKSELKILMKQIGIL